MSQLGKFREENSDLSWGSIEKLTGLIRNTLNKWDKAENRQTALENLLEGTRHKLKAMSRKERKQLSRKAAGRKSRAANRKEEASVIDPRIEKLSSLFAETVNGAADDGNGGNYLQPELEQTKVSPDSSSLTTDDIRKKDQVNGDSVSTAHAQDVSEQTGYHELSEGSGSENTREGQGGRTVTDNEPEQALDVEPAYGSNFRPWPIRSGNSTEKPVETKHEAVDTPQSTNVEQSDLDKLKHSIAEKHKLVTPLKPLTRNKKSPTYPLVLAHITHMQSMLEQLSDFGNEGRELHNSIKSGPFYQTLEWFNDLV